LRGVVLADTGPLYALRDPDDASHGRSREELGRLKAQRLRLVVPFPTLIESYALVQRKLGLAQARSFLRYLVRTTVLITPTEEDHRGAIGRVLRYPDQDISLADALCAEISDRIEAPVWTYDHHFDVMGARVWRF
jgi:predicted nucleic acid-binding protein